jgi:hypothetical protein
MTESLRFNASMALLLKRDVRFVELLTPDADDEEDDV